MSGEERRNRILEILSSSKEPVSGNGLSKLLGVSRQVIVTDIALLRTTRPDLISTNAGYMLMNASLSKRVFKVNHTDDETEDELTSIVDLGGTILDVFVEHKVYGTISAPLNISSKRDVQRFMDDLRSGVSTPLKNITQGYHYHTIAAKNPEVLDEIENTLREKGFLIEILDSTTIYMPKSYNEV
ncbi:MAG: transcription repressor NadR [Butyrivibrio sp.]|nr:transcription repressor NadR [Butyrivibrio sp.]